MKVYNTIKSTALKGLTFTGIMLTGIMLAGSSAVQAEDLYTLNGKVVSSESLTPEQLKQAASLVKATADGLQAAADKMILNEYFDSQAASQKKPRDELEQKAFEASEPTEKAIKDWYEANKAKIPATYEFEKIKGEIVKVVKQEAMKVKRDELLAKLKKDGKFALIRGTPEAKSPTAVAGAVYIYNGKTISTPELSPGLQQQFFEIEYQAFEQRRAFADSVLIGNHFAELAKTKKKTVEEVQKAEFDVKEPSEKAMKEWYTKNKSHIPAGYDYDKIKTQIAGVIKDEATAAKRTALLAKLKNAGKYAFTGTTPASPTVEIKMDGYPFKGKDGAKLTIIEFADFQCSHCKVASEVLKKIPAKYTNQWKYVFIDYPINPSGISKVVAEGSHCAADQNKYWEYHYKAFDGQSTLDKDSPTKFAADLKLDAAKFKTCFDGTKGKALVEKGRLEGERIGVSGTPYLIINGHRYLGAHTVAAFTKEFDTYLK